MEIISKLIKRKHTDISIAFYDNNASYGLKTVSSWVTRTIPFEKTYTVHNFNSGLGVTKLLRS